MKYEPRLDGLRFVAIFAVLLEHFIYFIGSKLSTGFYGVNLFFVISGFLITYILLSEKSSHFSSAYRRFLGRRFLRIFPIYYLAIVLLLILRANGIGQDWPYLFSYTFNYRIGISNNWQTPYSGYWSLAVEEQFYLFFPLLVLGFKNKVKWLVCICFGFILLSYAQIVFDIFKISKFNYVGLLTNMAPLCTGALGAVFVKGNSRSFFLGDSILVEICLFVSLFLCLAIAPWEIKLVICPVLSLLIVLKASAYRFSFAVVNKFLALTKLVFIGRISYGIYVYHGMVSLIFMDNLFIPLWEKIPFNSLGFFSKLYYNSWLISFPLLFGLTIVIAWLSYRFIEKPLLNLKDKYFRYRDTNTQSV